MFNGIREKADRKLTAEMLSESGMTVNQLAHPGMSQKHADPGEPKGGHLGQRVKHVDY